MNKTEAQKIISQTLKVTDKESETILKKAESGREFQSELEIEKWLNDRFLPNIISINEDGYAKMCIDALKILKSTSASDYGTSRQRDFGQLWGDMTRGYLAEYAFILFLQKHWNIKAELGHEKGKLEDYLPSDIHKIQKNSNKPRGSKIKIGIKGTKWNGIWLDIPGDQFKHSDIHVLVKVGTSRDHLFAYFKHISVFKDKVLKKGVELGALKQNEADLLFDNLPLFQPVPAYIAGFVIKNKYYKDLDYSGKKGKKHYTIQSWNGPIRPGDLEKIKQKEIVSDKVKFEGIGNFSHNKGYLFNTDNLFWKKPDWEKFVIKPL